LLSTDNTRELMELIQDGHKAYLIKAHLESSGTVATAFLEWVHDKGRVITNRTLIEDNLSWYEMLFISKAGRSPSSKTCGNHRPRLWPRDAAGRVGQRRQQSANGCAQSGAPHRCIFGNCFGIQLCSACGIGPGRTNGKSGRASFINTCASARHHAPHRTIGTGSRSHPRLSQHQRPCRQHQSGGGQTCSGHVRPRLQLAMPTSNMIRVPGEMLDQFMNQIGEMVLGARPVGPHHW
jgi:two-component system, chemotaxis family, sensor kinase CheA